MAKQKYFSHDSNARNDEKIVNMRMQMGAGSYAIYFMILDVLSLNFYSPERYL